MADLVEIRGLEGLKKKVELIEKSIFSKALMTEIGLFSQTKIKTRTLEGKDAEGSAFAPYSPKYAVFRRLEGRPINKVDLTFTGSMLASMTFDADKKKMDLFFINSEDEKGAKNPEKAFFNNQTRNFFALSEEDVQDIIKITEAYYNKLIRS